MALIGNLVLGFSVQTGAVSKGLKTVGSQISGFSSSIGSGLGKLTAFGAALGALGGFAGFGAGLLHSFEAIDDLGASADKLGATVEGLQGLQFAAGQSDLELEKLQAGLQLLNSQLGEVRGGSEAAADKFAQLGIDAAAIGNSSVNDALSQIADKIAGIANPADQAAAAASIFGRKLGPELLPLLKIGSGGIDALAARAKELGLVMSAADVAKVKEANDAVGQVNAALEGVFNTVAIKVAPIVTELSDRLLDSGVFGETASKAIATGLEWVAVGTAYLIDGFHLVEGALWLIAGVGGAVATVVVGIITGLVTVISESINWLFEAVGMARSEALDETSAAMQDYTMQVAGETGAMFKAADNAFSQPSAVAGVKAFFAEAEAGADAAANAIENKTVPATELLNDSMMKLGDTIEQLTDDWKLQADTFGMTSRQAEIYKLELANTNGVYDEQIAKLKELDAQLAGKENLKKLQDEGKAITDEVAMPLEKYQSQLTKLDELLAAGAISQETFGRAKSKAFDEVAQGAGGDEVKLAGAADRNSVEAYQTLTRASSMGGRGDPMQLLAQVQEQELEQSRTQTTLLRRLAKQGDEVATFDLN